MINIHSLRTIALAALSLLAVTFTQSVIFPQTITAQDPGRAASTKIVDALNQLPAQNAELFNRLMEDIVSTGQEGYDMLIATLEKKDASMVRAEYALDGLSAYASADSFDPAKRAQIIATFEKALLKIKSSDTEELDRDLLQFYAKQLKRLGVITAYADGAENDGSQTAYKLESAAQAAPLTKKEAEKALSVATKNAKRKPSQLNTALRCQALRNLIGVTGIVNGEKIILKALQDPCREYRFAALYAMEGKSPSVLYSDITALLPKLSDDAKADAIWWMGRQGDCYEDGFKQYLSSADPELAAAAAWALTKMKDTEAAPLIANFLTSKYPSRITTGEECMKSTSGAPALVAPLYQKTSLPRGKVAILDIIAQFKASNYKELVFNALSEEDNTVCYAAHSALKAVVSLADMDRLCILLDKADECHAEAIREAMLAATSDRNDAERYKIFVTQKNLAVPTVQDRYIPLLIRTASQDELFAMTSRYDQAIDAYIASIEVSNASGAQKLLLLRKAATVAKTLPQRSAILNAVGHTDTFLGLLYAGEFLEVKGLKQDAAQAVMRIALAHPEFYGDRVSSLLRHVCEVLDGPDAEYEKTAVRKHLGELPEGEGFVSMFDGSTLAGWKGLVEDPFTRATMKPTALAKAQKAADERMVQNWKVEDGCIVYEGDGFDNLCTSKQYGDFEMYLDWKLFPGAEPDAGIYLRGTPQVQIWDTSRVDVGAQVGSGGLYNNQTNPSKPLCVADNAVGEWNSFYIKMVGERVTVYLNGVLVVDNVILENYWDLFSHQGNPIPAIEQIELQAHGCKVAYRDLYIHELEPVKPIKLSAEEKSEGFELLFDGTDLHNWQGNKVDYITKNGTIEVSPTGQGFGNLYTNDEYSDFIFRFEFKLTPGANNGVGIRTPTEGDAAYVGMEIQILDHFDAIYQPGLRDYQYHGSVYGIIPAKVRTALNPVGEWNTEEIYAEGNHIRVTVNGIVITEGDIAKATANGTYDHNEHPGLFNKSGHIGFLGHGSQLWLRNIRVKKLR